MNENYAQLLTSFPLLQGLTVHGTQMLIDSGEVKEHEPGSILFTEGEPAQFTCLFLTGKLQVFITRKGRETVVQTPVPGTVLGELGVLCGLPRSASARAVEKSAVLQWSADRFRREMLRNAPLFERILRQSLRNLLLKEKSLFDELEQLQNQA